MAKRKQKFVSVRRDIFGDNYGSVVVNAKKTPRQIADQLERIRQAKGGHYNMDERFNGLDRIAEFQYEDSKGRHYSSRNRLDLDKSIDSQFAKNNRVARAEGRTTYGWTPIQSQDSVMTRMAKANNVP